MVSYTNYQRGTHSVPLWSFTLRLLTSCCQKCITLTASHIPGRWDLVADFLSRGKFLPLEWCLNQSVFDQIPRVCLPPPPPPTLQPNPEVLEKVAQDPADLFLVPPFWPKRPWFPRLLSLLVGPPKSLTISPDFLLHPYPASLIRIQCVFISLCGRSPVT